MIEKITPGNLPVHPCRYTFEIRKNDKYEYLEREFMGMTKREYFAALALQGLLANPDDPQLPHEAWAINAVRYADALIKALEIEAD